MKNPNSPWRFLFFPFILCLLVFCIYLIHLSNPHLMAQEALYDQLKLKRGADATLIRANDKLPADAVAPTALPYKNRQRTSQWPDSLRPSHRLERFDDVTIPGYAGKEAAILIDGDGAYIAQPTSLITHDINSKHSWTFGAPEGDEFLPGEAAVARKALFVASKAGRLYALDKSTGQLIWYRASQYKYLRQPYLGKTNLVLFAQGEKEGTWMVHLLNPQSGELIKTIGPIQGEPSGTLALNEDETIAYVTTSASFIYGLQLANGEILWKIESPAAFRGTPALHNDRVYAVNEEGVFFSHDGKNGREIWETDLGSKFSSSVSILPEAMMSYLIDKNGYIHAVSLRGGKREWRYNTNQAAHPQVMLLRMRGSSFAELKVEPRTRMWTLWTFCSSSRLCIFEPYEGQLLHRIELKGRPVSKPYFDAEGEDMWIGLVENWGDSGDAAKSLKLVHFMDAKKAKALREAQKNSPLGTPPAVNE